MDFNFISIIYVLALLVFGFFGFLALVVGITVSMVIVFKILDALHECGII